MIRIGDNVKVVDCPKCSGMVTDIKYVVNGRLFGTNVKLNKLTITKEQHNLIDRNMPLDLGLKDVFTILWWALFNKRKLNILHYYLNKGMKFKFAFENAKL